MNGKKNSPKEQKRGREENEYPSVKSTCPDMVMHRDIS